jgi:hypothetical protein
MPFLKQNYFLFLKMYQIKWRIKVTCLILILSQSLNINSVNTQKHGNIKISKISYEMAVKHIKCKSFNPLCLIIFNKNHIDVSMLLRVYM